MRNFLKWLGLIAFVFALFFFGYSTQNKQTYKQTAPAPTTNEKAPASSTTAGGVQYVKIGGVPVKVEVASTPEAKQLGLGGRSGLADDTGMLFVFYMPGKYAFWMKDMKFPIDIIWIRQDGEVVYLKKDLSPDSYPTTFRPEEDVNYVLEVPAGFSDQNDIKVGDKAEFIY